MVISGITFISLTAHPCMQITPSWHSPASPGTDLVGAARTCELRSNCRADLGRPMFLLGPVQFSPIHADL